MHADIEALDRALGHLKRHAVDAIYCAGDVVGYGPAPAETVARIVELGIPTVRGNHDRWAVERGAAMIDPYGVGPLSQTTLDALRCLPPLRIIEVEGKLVVITHGSPGNDMEYLTRQRFRAEDLRSMLGDISADFLVVGHTHEPMWYRCDQGMIINPGSLYSAPSRLRSSRTFSILDFSMQIARFYDVETGTEREHTPWDFDSSA